MYQKVLREENFHKAVVRFLTAVYLFGRPGFIKKLLDDIRTRPLTAPEDFKSRILTAKSSGLRGKNSLMIDFPPVDWGFYWNSSGSWTSPGGSQIALNAAAQSGWRITIEGNQESLVAAKYNAALAVRFDETV